MKKSRIAIALLLCTFAVGVGVFAVGGALPAKEVRGVVAPQSVKPPVEPIGTGDKRSAHPVGASDHGVYGKQESQVGPLDHDYLPERHESIEPEFAGTEAFPDADVDAGEAETHLVNSESAPHAHEFAYLSPAYASRIYDDAIGSPAVLPASRGHDSPAAPNGVNGVGNNELLPPADGSKNTAGGGTNSGGTNNGDSSGDDGTHDHNDSFKGSDPETHSVPEPGTSLLFGISLIGMVLAQWRRRKRTN